MSAWKAKSILFNMNDPTTVLEKYSTSVIHSTFEKKINSKVSCVVRKVVNFECAYFKNPLLEQIYCKFLDNVGHPVQTGAVSRVCEPVSRLDISIQDVQYIVRTIIP